MKHLFYILIFSACSNSEKPAQTPVNQTAPSGTVKTDIETVYIQPLGEVDTLYTHQVQRSVQHFFGTRCEIKTMEALSDDILAASGTRYEAGKILDKYKSGENILLLTEADIACKKGTVPEWGIFGLGYRPGKTCVVSTFRLKRNAKKKKQLERVTKVSLHEIGHNLGLDHCKAHPQCLMNDANGKISQVDKEEMWFCAKCSRQIGN